MRAIKRTKESGLLLIELIIVTAISVLIFGSLFISFQFTVELIGVTRSKLSALSLANDRMEFFRSLPYDEVGVVAGFPAGVISQTSTRTLNGIDFSERVRVDYVDDPADDVAGVDSNAIITDYKQVKLEYTWSVNGEVKDLALTSFIVPRAIESNVGGGTARINVLDADSTPLSGASVRLFSSSSTFAYDVTNPTDASGSALFAVPADSGYQVEVTANIGGDQYSTAQTYVATTSNPNPVVGPFAVLEADVSTLTFQIGELSDLEMAVKSSVVESSFLETFTGVNGIASTTPATVSGSGQLVLSNSGGFYETSGTVYLDPFAPAPLERWQVVRLATFLPLNTSFQVQFFTGDASTAYTLIPDSDLPGNAVGFTDSLIDISSLDSATYPSITAGIVLQTSDTSVSPEIQELEVFWRESSVDQPGLTLEVQGDKIIGTETDGSSIFKTINTVTTDAAGQVLIPDLEFDSYQVTPATALDLASACPAHPIAHNAGIDSLVELVFVSDAANTLRVAVVDSLGRVVPGAEIRLERSGYDTTQFTGGCGQTFFTGGLSDNGDYTLTVSASGFSTEIVDPFSVSEDTVVTIILNP